VDLSTWMDRLLAAVTVLGGFSAPDLAPHVTIMPQTELARRVCGAADCPVRGAYLPETGVLLDSGLNIDDPRDRSVLLHEIVHYLQQLSGRFGQEPLCRRFVLREVEAYSIQDQYLSRYGLGVGNSDYSLMTWMPPGCTMASLADEATSSEATHP